MPKIVLSVAPAANPIRHRTGHSFLLSSLSQATRLLQIQSVI
ncbi:hypothetical protein HCEG_04945 [Histoplasma capsulatum var. duboisii H88]|uniref:Uncharacterized protein n=1 Tax=Ajellomyces capsulatus (strain H88) TaxID=544711 RepID=F0UJD4_AJEC8|nr:hypothetical protein HCEG_04945 [Histoplasma capsulatum var. duboisii H88]